MSDRKINTIVASICGWETANLYIIYGKIPTWVILYERGRIVNDNYKCTYRPTRSMVPIWKWWVQLSRKIMMPTQYFNTLTSSHFFMKGKTDFFCTVKKYWWYKMSLKNMKWWIDILPKNIFFQNSFFHDYNKCIPGLKLLGKDIGRSWSYSFLYQKLFKRKTRYSLKK